MTISEILTNEELRQKMFPVAGKRIFLGHAGVSPLPAAAVEGICAFADAGSKNQQEAGRAWASIDQCRAAFGRLLGAEAEEIALLGPTALGLSLVANGLEWKSGDEVVFYQDDYPANVYPWVGLERHGVKLVRLQPERQGWIDWPVVEAALTPKTRLVSIATANFLSGYRPPVEEIGRELHTRGILFCLDGIQTLGAFPLNVEHVDFLSADSHKWLLGPVGAGVVYVKKSRFAELRPTLLGAWNVESPGFIAQEKVDYYPGARRYEPGTLNLPGIMGMLGALEVLLEVGVEEISRRILVSRAALSAGMREMGFEVFPGKEPGAGRQSGIISFDHPMADLEKIWHRLSEVNVSVSLRENRAGRKFLRCSPHFYNTDEEISRALEAVRAALG